MRVAQVSIYAKQAKLLTGGVKILTTKQPSLKLAVEWVRAIIDNDDEKIDSISINVDEE